MTYLLKLLIAVSDKYIGRVSDAEMHCKRQGIDYSRDAISVEGVTAEGRKYRLELTLEDGNNDS